ncbi:MAG: hypothetical protein B7Y39_04305 [Bdellovibrio sp. 28-41-41]|nr:MAG: hypothetical protein B7Y39_04305 [Bdellovibrio sp. 28-41-41]
MKNNILIGISIVSIVTANVFAQEEGNGFRAGATLAVQEANLKDGFRLTDKAKEAIGVKTKALGPKPFKLSANSLVHYSDKVGVYRLRQGWFKLIEVKKTNQDNGSVLISSSDLKESDDVAVEGVALLRVSEMDAFGGEE